MAYELILLAAGQSRRMVASRNKVLLNLANRPVITYSLATFLADFECQHIILVVKEDEASLMEQVLVDYFGTTETPIDIVIGGLERQDSVYQGLLAVNNSAGHVLIHDGARPFVKKSLLIDLYQEVQRTSAAIVAVPVKDTIKKVVAQQVVETIPRETLWQVQTPQGFICQELLGAHEKALVEGVIGTDDSSLMERYSQREVSVVVGDYDNIKLTTPDDMILGAAFVSQ